MPFSRIPHPTLRDGAGMTDWAGWWLVVVLVDMIFDEVGEAFLVLEFLECVDDDGGDD